MVGFISSNAIRSIQDVCSGKVNYDYCCSHAHCKICQQGNNLSICICIYHKASTATTALLLSFSSPPQHLCLSLGQQHTHAYFYPVCTSFFSCKEAILSASYYFTYWFWQDSSLSTACTFSAKAGRRRSRSFDSSAQAERHRDHCK